MSSESPRFIRAGKILALVLLLAATAAVGWRWMLHARVERELAAIRAEGYPATPEELQAWYRSGSAGFRR